MNSSSPKQNEGTSTIAADLRFLEGGGEMGQRIRDFDWSKTPLGTPERWPQSLRSAVSMLLPSKAQIVLFWGPKLVSLYNDNYRSVIAGKHPRVLGLPCWEAWDELWNSGLKDLMEGVIRTGEAFWASDSPFIIERAGYLEETYFDVSFDPVRDESGEVGGIFCIVNETTRRVLGERRLRTLSELGARATKGVESAEEACRIASLTLDSNRYDVPFNLLYLLDADGQTAKLASCAGIDAGSTLAQQSIHNAHQPGNGAFSWPIAEVLGTGTAQVITKLTERAEPLPAGVWLEFVHSAVILPFRGATKEQPIGFLIAGVSPRRALDEAYLDFFELAASQAATAIANARAYEEEKKRADVLAALDRAKTTFFANVSHEFRTPLTLILGPVEDALADPETSTSSRERLSLVHRNGLRMLKLVNSLLDFSRLEAGRIKALYEPLDLSSLTAELASNFRSAMERAGLSLIVDCRPLPEPVYVDREMWEKIVLNILSNAFKFTFEGEIEVTLKPAGSQAEFRVRDTGVGIPAEEMPRVFERFHRIETTRSRTHEGSGIGLALVQELVKLHGGTVRAESVVGQGTTFIVSMPVGKAHLAVEQVSTQRSLASTSLGAAPFVEEALRWLPEPASAHGTEVSTLPKPPAVPDYGRGQLSEERPRVIVADDNADMRNYLARLLSEKYEVKAVADGNAALAAASERRPDLILSDVMMPGLDGYGLVKQLRASEATRTIPIILLSARAGEESRLDGLDSGADDYLVKPFSARELMSRVQAHIRLARLRQETEQALFESERRFRLLFDQAGDGIFVLDTQGCYVDVNEAACRMTGYAREELLRLTPVDLVLAEDLHRIETELAKYADGSVSMSEWRSRRKDGSIFLVEALGRQLPDGRVQVIVRDITERKQLEKEFADNERQLRSMVDSIDQLAWTANADGGIYWFNKRWYEYTGTTPAEMEGWGWQSVHDPEILPEVMEHWTTSIRTGTPFDMIFPLKGADGVFRPFLTRANPLCDPEGKVLKWFGTNTDIDAIRRAEASVREAEERFHHLADNIPQLAWIADAGTEGRIHWFNQNWFGYTGTTLQEMQGSGWHKVHHPDHAERVIQKFSEHVQAGLDWEDTFPLRRKDGEFRWFLSRMRCIRDESGKVIRIFGTNTDITERRETEQQLTRANLDLESFAYSASHDLQEPLRMITSYSQMLVKGFRGQLDGEAEMCVGFIEDGTRRMRELLADLLAYTAVDSKAMDGTETIDLNNVFQEVTSTLKVAIEESRAVVASDPLPIVHGHRAHFIQLFQNLISNAIKYRSKRAPLINVSAEEREGVWRFAVSDNGMGIAHQHHDKVFGVFKRLHGRKIPGTGIGLAICQRVVERYKGRIWVESEMDKGATFYFTLPLTKETRKLHA